MVNSTDQVIEDLVVAIYQPPATEQQKHILREAMRGLVRLAKAEQLLQMKLDVNAAIGTAD